MPMRGKQKQILDFHNSQLFFSYCFSCSLKTSNKKNCQLRKLLFWLKLTFGMPYYHF